MPVRCTEDQDLVGEKDERGKALSANVVKSVGKLPYCPSYPSDINRTTYKKAELVMMVCLPSCNMGHMIYI